MKFSICWNITSRCNYTCKFCNRIECYEELELEKCFLIVDKLKEFGIKKVTLTGGEVFLYKDLQPLIDYIHKKNILISILTNGLLITKDFLEKNNEKVFQIGFPIDTTSIHIQKIMGRDDNHLKNIINILELIKKCNFDYKIKINTVVTKCNYNSIKNINAIVNKYKVRKWNIFLYNSIRNVAKENTDFFSLEKKDFEKLKLLIDTPYTDVSFSDQSLYENEHIIISPYGELIITRDSKDIVIGKAYENITFNELKKYGVFI